jgi:hypothetical protein
MENGGTEGAPRGDGPSLKLEELTKIQYFLTVAPGQKTMEKYLKINPRPQYPR